MIIVITILSITIVIHLSHHTSSVAILTKFAVKCFCEHLRRTFKHIRYCCCCHFFLVVYHSIVFPFFFFYLKLQIVYWDSWETIIICAVKVKMKQIFEVLCVSLLFAFSTNCCCCFITIAIFNMKAIIFVLLLFFIFSRSKIVICACVHWFFLYKNNQFEFREIEYNLKR